MLNLSALFYSTVHNDTLLSKLDLSERDLATIAEARNAVRDELRGSLARALRDADHELDVRPRFFTQGSFAYGTLNGPAKPPQQADIDFGVYLPMSFMTGTGGPRVAARVFFDAAERVLEDVARERGWRVLKDKATCIRVEINASAHLDVPLYAIPDNEFETLKEAAARTRIRLDSLGPDASASDENDVWERLPDDSVLLAHRKEGWKKSDPRPLKRWFLQQVEDQGEQLRRVVRYLKALRDWEWKSAGPSSILLMASASQIFDQCPRRDDLALLTVLERLPRTLRGGVANPTDQTESLTERLDDVELEKAAAAFERRAGELATALDRQPVEACTLLQEVFGPRFPNKPELATQDSVDDRVRAFPPAVVPSPLVGPTRSA
jgi:hypothetical protein